MISKTLQIRQPGLPVCCWQAEDEEQGEDECIQESAYCSMYIPDGTVKEALASAWKKKLFTFAGKCKFCRKKGHDVSFCPFIYNGERSETELQVQAVPALAGKSFDDAKEILQQACERNRDITTLALPDTRPNRLRKRISMWQAIGAPRIVLDWIRYGVQFQFAMPVAKKAFANHPSAMAHADFVRSEIACHVKEGVFRKVNQKSAWVINPILVDENAKGKLRMCIDSRFVNAHLPHISFKMETLQRNAPITFKKGAYQFTIDLEKAYYSVPIHPDSHKYFAFEFDGSFYVPTILTFGTSLAPLIFTKITRPIVKLLRSLEIFLISFIDDFDFSDLSRERLASARSFILWLLDALGFLVSVKSSLDCEFVKQFLGLVIDLERFMFLVPSTKRDRLLGMVINIMQRKHVGVNVHDLQQITGLLASMSLAVGPALLMSRGLHADIKRLQCTLGRHRETTKLSATSLAELEFWRHNFDRFNGLPISDGPPQSKFSLDAAEFGWGFEAPDGTLTSGLLPASVIGKSSTLREMTAVLLFLQNETSRLTGKRILLELDSQPAVFNFNKGGGPITELTQTAKEVFEIASNARITLLFKWKPREQNTGADKASKFYNSWSYQLRPGVESVLPRHTCVVDFNHMTQFLSACTRDKISTTFLHPIWESAAWWPQLCAIAKGTTRVGLMRDVFQNADEFPPWIIGLSRV